MNWILHIETATDICSVALSEKNQLIDYVTLYEKNIHSAKLTTIMDELMKRSSISYSNLAAVSVSKGPGSFTGLRIGVSLAKGICYGIQKPLMGINTLQSLVSALKRNTELADENICSLLDARNNEVYYAVYDKNNKVLLAPQVGLLEPGKLKAFHQSNTLIFVGDGVDKWTADYNNQVNVKMLSNILPDARNLISLSWEKYQNKDFELLESFEPYYLRDFKAKKGSLKIKKILKTD
ncbi:MAG: tRNA (adenosine(37)-N6)-threonylcarbamoyltransferase complex dimerization subunit type 1 TsaB [Bacteroidetes bacterium]|nr:tRNA (adenosine(37)-N6)-threonylcarbamoyltransferase complex dimerization subunit type 1 TsaB [Bacteroidota bacterium]